MKTSKYGFRGAAAVAMATALAGLALAGAAAAGPQATTTYGDPFTWLGAESAAMGGTGAATYRGGLSTVFNPAFLVVESGRRLDAGIVLDQAHEDRFQPLFDSFESWVVDAAIASNRHHLWQSGFGLAARVGDGPRAVAVGLSLADRFPYGYAFSEELRNPSPFPPGSGEPARDMLIAVRERTVTGTLRAISFGVAAETSEKASLGVALNYHYGTRRDAASSIDLDNAGTNESYRASDELKLAGANLTAGLRARLGERVDLGLAVESKLRATGDWRRQELDVSPAAATATTTGSFLDYPWCARAGLTLRPRNALRTVFTVEIEYRPWSELRDGTLDDTTPILHDAADVRLGVEHIFYNGMPLRFGFRHLASYADRDAAITAFTAGTAARVGEGRLNASVELAKTTSVLAHQFPYPTAYFGDTFVADPMARVEDTRFRVGVSYAMEF
ncbi:hypothetical protein FJ250_04290 [bacterium]|nr:hypothetical protein [bacterium]